MRPLLMFGVLYVVFSQVFRFGGDVNYYPVVLLMAIVVYEYFSEATANAVHVGRSTARTSCARSTSRAWRSRSRSRSPRRSTCAQPRRAALLLRDLRRRAALELARRRSCSSRCSSRSPPASRCCSRRCSSSTATSARSGTSILRALFYATPIIYPIEQLARRNETLAHIAMCNPLAVDHPAGPPRGDRPHRAERRRGDRRRRVAADPRAILVGSSRSAVRLQPHGARTSPSSSSRVTHRPRRRRPAAGVARGSDTCCSRSPGGGTGPGPRPRVGFAAAAGRARRWSSSCPGTRSRVGVLALLAAVRRRGWLRGDERPDGARLGRRAGRRSSGCGSRCRSSSTGASGCSASRSTTTRASTCGRSSTWRDGSDVPAHGALRRLSARPAHGRRGARPLPRRPGRRRRSTPCWPRARSSPGWRPSALLRDAAPGAPAARRPAGRAAVPARLLLRAGRLQGDDPRRARAGVHASSCASSSATGA